MYFALRNKIASNQRENNRKLESEQPENVFFSMKPYTTEACSVQIPDKQMKILNLKCESNGKYDNHSSVFSLLISLKPNNITNKQKTNLQA